MSVQAVVSFAAMYFSLIVAAAVLVRDRYSFVHGLFAAGMGLLAGEEVLRGLSYVALLPTDVLYWQKAILIISPLISGVWLVFSIVYARTTNTDFVNWRWILFSLAFLIFVLL